MYKKIMIFIACIYSGFVMSMDSPRSPLVWDIIPTNPTEIYSVLTDDLNKMQEGNEGIRTFFLHNVWLYKKDDIEHDIGHLLQLDRDKDGRIDPYTVPSNYCLIVEYILMGRLDFSPRAIKNVTVDFGLPFTELSYANPALPVRIPAISHMANVYISQVYRQLQIFKDSLDMINEKIQISEMPRDIKILSLLESIIPPITPTIRPTVESALQADLTLKRALQVIRNLGEDVITSVPEEYINHILIGGTVFDIDIETNKLVVNKELIQEWIKWTLP